MLLKNHWTPISVQRNDYYKENSYLNLSNCVYFITNKWKYLKS